MNIFLAVFGNLIHLLKVFFVNLALIKAKGILFFLAVKIKFGQISESTKIILSGLHCLKNLSIKKFISKGINLWCILSKFLYIFSAKFPELKVVVVIKISILSILINSSIIGTILLNSPILAA